MVWFGHYFYYYFSFFIIQSAQSYWTLCLCAWIHSSASHLEQSSLVSVVLLALSSLYVHLVPLTGANHLVEVVDQSRVQRVSVYQAHQVLPVVLTVGTNTHLNLRSYLYQRRDRFTYNIWFFFLGGVLEKSSLSYNLNKPNIHSVFGLDQHVRKLFDHHFTHKLPFSWVCLSRQCRVALLGNCCHKCCRDSEPKQ